MTDSDLANLPRRLPRSHWHEEHAVELWEKNKNVSTDGLVKFYDESDTTIQSAINFRKPLTNGEARKIRGQEVHGDDRCH
jgi:hypothetical protein